MKTQPSKLFLFLLLLTSLACSFPSLGTPGSPTSIAQPILPATLVPNNPTPVIENTNPATQPELPPPPFARDQYVGCQMPNGDTIIPTSVFFDSVQPPTTPPYIINCDYPQTANGATTLTARIYFALGDTSSATARKGPAVTSDEMSALAIVGDTMTILAVHEGMSQHTEFLGTTKRVLARTPSGNIAWYHCGVMTKGDHYGAYIPVCTPDGQTVIEPLHGSSGNPYYDFIAADGIHRNVLAWANSNYPPESPVGCNNYPGNATIMVDCDPVNADLPINPDGTNATVVITDKMTPIFLGPGSRLITDRISYSGKIFWQTFDAIRWDFKALACVPGQNTTGDIQYYYLTKEFKDGDSLDVPSPFWGSNLTDPHIPTLRQSDYWIYVQYSLDGNNWKFGWIYGLMVRSLSAHNNKWTLCN